MPAYVHRYPVFASLTCILILGFASECAAQSAGEKYFTNIELVEQSGRKMRFYEDVLRNKVVVINTFHTDCKSITLPMLRNLQKIQEAFAANLGKDLFLVSITVDPENDTPVKVGQYAKQWQAKTGWLFLTGSKENVSTVLKKLGQYVENKEDHTSIFIIGNDRTGLWKKPTVWLNPKT